MAYVSRQSSYLLGSVGAALQVVAGWWDVYSHLLFRPVDPWWNPAHLALYLGVLLVIIAVWRGLRSNSHHPALSASPIRFVNIVGLKLAAVGAGMEIVAGAWNEVVHRVLLVEPRIAPAHALLTVGMLTVNLGIVTGLSIELGMIRREILVVSVWRRLSTYTCTLLAFASIWLVAAGALIYVAVILLHTSFVWVFSVFLALFATFVLVPAKRVLPEFGSAAIIGIVFNVVAYYFLVIFLEGDAYVPWGVLVLLLFDIVIRVLQPRAGFSKATLIGSAMVGASFYALYFPFTLYLFPWSMTLQPSAALVTFGGVAGALLGLRIYSGMSAFVLGDVPQTSTTGYPP